jgi:DNA-binding transcriptional regulator YdaS (Cro superfamily)
MTLADFVSKYGGQTDLARAIGAPAQLVWQWARGVRPVPIGRCVPIERATAGAVTRKDLRPDDWQDIWPELADAPPTTTTEPAQAGV